MRVDLRQRDFPSPLASPPLAPGSQDPIRAELFGPERLEELAERVARRPVLAEGKSGRLLSPRVRDSGRVLLQCYREIAAVIREEGAITPAAEWFVDNFHIADEVVRQVREDLPRGFYRQLPKLADEPLQGYPRVLGLAWAFVAHTDSRFEAETLQRFVRRFQRVQPLTIGELWAIPIALRLVLVENLRRLAERIVSGRTARLGADALADELLGLGGRPHRPLAFQRVEAAALSPAFMVNLVQRLREQDPESTPALRWLDERLTALGTSADELVQLAHQNQAAMNVTVRNVITSMRMMSTFDWADFFESVSLVDHLLRTDRNFSAMDFATRDRYRHAIEDLARRSGRPELDVTRLVMAHAKRAAGTEPGDRAADPGYYLLAQGRASLETEIGYRPPPRERLLRAFLSAATPSYLTTIATVTGLLLALPLLAGHTAGMSPGALVLMALLATIPASDLALALINRSVMDLIGPRPLPRLELPEGVPANLRTLVVVPTLLTSAAEIEEHINRLEIHFLANPDGHVHFALLSDWCDAAAEHLPEDARLLALATDGIARLNARSGAGPAGGDRFLLLHRRRVWNAGEGIWMGWERKRGKLDELNRLLTGTGGTTFAAPGGPPAGVRYVITLDADTRLPRGAVNRLVGTMAHPLNRPVFDARAGRVVDGYAVLQPRITATIPTDRDRSLFQRIFAGPAGLDPYPTASSDVYQDLFGEGSYTGKGIYDVTAFTAALKDRVPENSLLSHDLFEGIFARAGLVTDIELFEDSPTDYEVAAGRQHRWARGDWQLLPWIIRGDTGAGPRPVWIPAIGLWKIIDNLRRTLSAPAATLTLVAGWVLPHSPPLAWTTFVLATIALPSLFPAFAELIPRRSGISKRTHLRSVGRSFAIAGSQITLGVTFLAHQAWLMADAIGRTLVRLYLTHRRLLEWTTAAQAKSDLSRDISGVYRRMGGALTLAAAAGILVVLLRPSSAAVAAPFLLLWGFSPAAARWVSRPPPAAPRERLAPADTAVLRSTARRTWRFFETFVGPDDAFLPPDNLQEDPRPVLAHRTSPTNIGLYLLSVVSARDLGWLGLLDTLDRLEATLATMRRLETFRGHLYNWYDTAGLRPLEPRYVSTVDSGNLAAHLLALGGACRGAMHEPLPHPDAFAGIDDALLLAGEAATALADAGRSQTVTVRHLAEAREALAAALREAPRGPAESAAHVGRLAGYADTLVDVSRVLAPQGSDAESAGVLIWAQAARATIASHARDLATLMPWAARAEPADAPPEILSALGRLCSSPPSPADLPERCRVAIEELTAARDAALREDSPAVIARIDDLVDGLARSSAAARALAGRLLGIARAATDLVDTMQFGFLFDPTRKIFSIGYRVTDGSLDSSAYDLLASEARLASFIAIAKGDVPVAHWFHLGRPMTPVGRGSVLVSWSGSMFEYLMPALVMHAPAGSLLEETCRLVVRRQIGYGAEHGVPWGVSESAYNVRDLDLTFQYSNFGVPGLGLERGLGEDLVVAPYATALAAMVDPAAAARNFSSLAAVGARGPYGFYEALDYTRARVPEGATLALVRAYMAHHQGMTLVALANVLREGVMRARFHAEPMVQATDLLLQERAPRDVAVARPRLEEVDAPAHVRDFVAPVFRRFTTPHGPRPRTHLLSNGRYAVMLTTAGSGYSRCAGLGITRWREDATRDPWGTYVFLRDVESGAVWSAAYQPTGVEPAVYRATFSEDRAEFHRQDGTLTTTLEVIVSPEDDAEIRRVSVTNLGDGVREVELTSYAELVLAPPAADAAHPAFSNLFVQTERLADLGALLATRRVRSATEPAVWAAHTVVVEGQPAGGAQYETDRARFLGRGRTIRTPMSVIDGRPLSNTAGSVLDPIFSLRHRIRLAPGECARLVFSTMVAPSRDAAVALADKYRDPATFERTVTFAWTQAQVQLHHLGIDPNEAHLFQNLASRILYSDPTMRAAADVLRQNTSGPSALWAHQISGDVPIVLVRIDEPEDRGIVRQLLRAHEYWRMKGLAVDLVILNERAHSYVQELQTSLEALVRTSHSASRPERDETRGRVFILRRELLSPADHTALQAAARAVLLSRHGTLAEQLARAEPAEEPAALPARRRASAAPTVDAPPLRLEAEFFNGVGGFLDGGREYVTMLGEGQWTPAPWINVIANATFGFLVSESGAGYTWALNSRENQLTPWSNDAVGDPPGEAIYVRDEENGALWGPTLLPIREDASPYVARHGQGYSRFEHTSRGIGLELLQFVPPDDPIKVSRLTLRNHSGKARRLSVTAYVEWVLGASRGASAPSIVTEVDPETGALLARNAWNTDFAGRVAFADLGGRQTAWTGDRTEVLGRNGTLDHPAMLERGTAPSGRVGAGLDPCAALQATIDMPPGGREEIVFFLGQASSVEAARALLIRYRAADVDLALDQIKTHWDDTLGAVQVKTPDRSMDLMLNRWLLYQTLACRVWARSAFYQAGGAYGFRDQLQDVMALVVAKREITREHLLRAAARQFLEGDVQHWWHPPSGKGVRTRISDDSLWLPYAVTHYLEITGDATLLDELIPFLEGPPVPAGQDDLYSEPTVSAERGTLFEHCARALDRSLHVGAHGLPLMGTGDWNDGMNRVGHDGRGESVWLGWFLHATLWEFARLAEARGERARADAWRAHVGRLKTALEQHAWDGDWYRRAYFDDGTPLGSVASPECRIDSIAQSWGVISGAAAPARAARAMAAVEEYLVRRDQELILLFTPPFDRWSMDPGYIKGYPPGIRENGGQYTHAAIWTVMAFAALGDGDRANELFSILNPINRTSTRAGVHRYRGEPYVAVADVYAEYPHVGRGGWTWYTGSAGWMYRAGLESLLGFRLRGAVLHLDPCIPRAWPRFEIAFRYHASRYEITVENPRGVTRGICTIEVDGVPLVSPGGSVPLVGDGAIRRVRVVLG
ncbi:MAG TPA: glucoamylase family protein [Candidatus Limnocylindria bacterium]|nr:glucoamylase family protein [Candidatus Limnocylindria bacterium]